MAYDAPLVVDKGGVLGYHHHLVGVGGDVGVEVALLRIEAVAAQGGSRVVVHLVAIVHLSGVEHLLSRHGVYGVEALHGPLLVFVGFARQRFFPVEVRSHGVAVLVFGDEIGFVATVCRVGKTCAQDRVAHPEDKLLVFRVGHLGVVHPETVN